MKINMVKGSVLLFLDIVPFRDNFLYQDYLNLYGHGCHECLVPADFLGLTAWHPRILADQFTLSNPGMQIMPAILLLGTRTSKILTQA